MQIQDEEGIGQMHEGWEDILALGMGFARAFYLP